MTTLIINAYTLEKREQLLYTGVFIKLYHKVINILKSKINDGIFSNLLRNILAQPPPDTDLQFQIQTSSPIPPQPPHPNINLRLPLSHNNLASSGKAQLFPARLQIFGSHPHNSKSSTIFFFFSEYYRKQLKLSTSCQLPNSKVA